MRKLLLIILVVLFLLCSCSKSNLKINTDANVDNKINIYYIKYNTIIKNSIDKFRETYKDAEIEVSVFDNYEDYSTQLISELSAGGGPDIVCFTWYTFNSIYKTINSGVFKDLQPLINKDEYFDLTNFNNVIMDCGIVDNKRYFMPIDFTVPLLWTTNDIINKLDFQLDQDNWTWEQLLKQCDNNNKTSNIFGGLQIDPFYYLTNIGYKFIDYSKKKCYFKTDQFLDILKNYKQLYELSVDDKTSEKYAYNNCDMIKDLPIILLNDVDLFSPTNLAFQNSIVKQFLDSEIKIYSYPTVKNSKDICAVPSNMISINQNCKNAELAFEFIKTVLSKDIQNDNLQYASAVNIEAINSKIEELKDSNYCKNFGSNVYNTVKYCPLSDELIKNYQCILDNISYCQLLDSDIVNYIYESFIDYVNEQITAETAAKQLQEKVTLFLNE